ncbi:MAG: CYCXC family (seleno)protein [Terriglobales bacterium]
MRRLLSLAFVALLTVATFGQGGPAADVPAFHSAPPKAGEKLPSILPKEQLWGPSFKYPVQTRAYELAAKIPHVLYQQPCYCHCDRSVGHTSLHSCFESTHAAHCDACMKELYYSYQMTKQHKTPAQIRKGIVNGEWEKVSLDTAASIR